MSKLLKIPFVQFPADWKIAFLPPTQTSMSRFLVKKEGVLNIVSVALFLEETPKYPEDNCWEVAVANEYPISTGWGITDDGEANIPLEDIEGLLESIEEFFHREPTGY